MEVVGSVEILAHGRGFGRPGMVRVGASGLFAEDGVVAEDGHGLMDNCGHVREELVVAGGRLEWVAECWAAHKGRLEANAQLEQAEANRRLERAVETRQ